VPPCIAVAAQVATQTARDWPDTFGRYVAGEVIRLAFGLQQAGSSLVRGVRNNWKMRFQGRVRDRTLPDKITSSAPYKWNGGSGLCLPYRF